MVKQSFHPDERTKAFGFPSARSWGWPRSSARSSAGTVLRDADLFGTGWRAIFLINLPIGLFTFLHRRAKRLPDTKPRAPRKVALDVPRGLLIASRRSGRPWSTRWCRVTSSAGRSRRSKLLLVASTADPGRLHRHPPSPRRSRSGTTSLIEPPPAL